MIYVIAPDHARAQYEAQSLGLRKYEYEYADAYQRLRGTRGGDHSVVYVAGWKTRPDAAEFAAMVVSQELAEYLPA